MLLRGGRGALQKLLRSTLQPSPTQGNPATPQRLKWTSSLGSGFDGSGFSDEEDNHYEEARKFRLGYGEPGSVTLKGNEDACVDEFNKEMEAIFGAVPPSHLGTSSDTKGQAAHRTQAKTVMSTQDEAQALDPARTNVNTNHDTKDKKQRFSWPSPTNLDASESTDGSLMASGLSHVDSAGRAAMVNVATKDDTKRVAVASGRVLLGPHAFALVTANSIAKGDVLTVAKISGVMGAKQTANLIPLCHNLLLSGVDLSLTLDEASHAVDIEAKVTTVGPTGVEMEALTAVSVASLTVYDMCKAVSKDIKISDIRLESKTGGKSGDWHRQQE